MGRKMPFLDGHQIPIERQTMFLDLIRRRRSVRRFLDRPVETQAVDRLVEAALRAPSSRGLNPWRFVVVSEPETLRQLARAKPHGAAFLRDAPLALVVCADPTVSDVWVEDASIASIFIHLAAADAGLGSCWIQIRKRPHDEERTAEAFVADRLGLPEGLRVESIVAVGHPAEEKKGHPDASLQREKVHYQRFSP